MADLHLAKPSPATSSEVPCAPGSRFVFDFSTQDAALSRNGDNLVFTFGDGAKIRLVDFYKAYSSEQMPSFAMEGVEVSGADFFAAMN